jgi:hypothetical protein
MVYVILSEYTYVYGKVGIATSYGMDGLDSNFCRCKIFRHYARSRKVAGSNRDQVFFFNWPNPPSCTMVLGSFQPLTEMSTRNLPRV